MKTIVIGATGLVGTQIVKQLLELPAISEVKIFVRRKMGLVHPKLKEEIVNFKNIADWESMITGDILFSALGTTLKIAGSRDAQYTVDHEYQFQLASRAAQNGVQTFVLISSTGADAASNFFYLRMKGELEEMILQLGFRSINILRPGPLLGKRKIPRSGEYLFAKIFTFVPSFLVPNALRPVKVSQVASVAIGAGLEAREGVVCLEAEEIHRRSFQ